MSFKDLCDATFILPKALIAKDKGATGLEEFKYNQAPCNINTSRTDHCGPGPNSYRRCA